LVKVEGHVAGGVIASRRGTLRGRRTWHVRNLHAREPGDPVVDRGLLMMPRPGWFAGWQVGGRWPVRGTLRR
jgi:hypothetical protein